MPTASTRINVAVTSDDIERAHRNNSYACVVAQAIARSVTDAMRVEVDTQTIRFTRGEERLVYLTPYVVQGYVIAFDAGDPIEPFTFQLREPIRVKRHLRTKAAKVAERERNIRRGRTTSPEAIAAVEADAREVYGSSTKRSDQRVVDEPAAPRAVPRVFKRKARTYGHRLLRINQS